MIYVLKHAPKTGDSNAPSERLIYIKPGKEYVCGRKAADIILEDPSISRKHASLKIDRDTIVVQDLGSKYGTFYKNKKLNPEEPKIIQDQQKIRFGVYNSIFSFEKIEFVTTSSGYSVSDKTKLRQMCVNAGAKYQESWDSSCTHLTVPEIVLTVKVLHGIIDQKPFVTPEFWVKVTESLKKNQPLPNPEDYKPKTAESLMRDEVNYEVNRGDLFSGKVFVFQSDNMKQKMTEVIAKTGGSCVAWGKDPFSFSEVEKSPDKFVFISSEDPKNTPKSLMDVYTKLMGLNLRTVPCQEIAHAIYIGSCDKDCNPRFNRLAEVFAVKTENIEDAVKLAPETQHDDLIDMISPKYEETIPETLETDFVSKKRPQQNLQIPSNSRSDSEPSAKKSRLEETAVESSFMNSFLNKPRPASTPKSINTDNPFLRASQKRSAELPDKEPPAKKSATPKVTSQSNNPFANLRNARPKSSSVRINPFAIMKEKEASLQREISPQKIGEYSNRQPLQDLYVQNSLDSTTSHRSKLSEVKWLNKSIVQSPIKVDMDDETRKISESFRDTVVIQKVAFLVRRQSYVPQISLAASSNTPHKNFKKFTKVPPKHPQTTIISCSATVVAGPTSPGNLIADERSDDEEVEVNRPRPVIKITGTKSFNF